MRRVFFLFLIVLSFSWNTAKAQENHELPLKIQQNWAFPDCAHGKEALIFTRFFMFSAEKASLSLKSYTPKKDGKNGWRIDKDPVEIENDGLLKIGGKSYTACDSAPKVMPKAVLRLTRYLDRIREQCTVAIENDCARVLFKMADENSDKKLTAAEIKKGLLSVMLFAEMADKKNLNEKEIKEVTARVREDSLKISGDLFKYHDSDKSKTLDYNELTTDFTAPKAPGIKEMIQKAAKLIPVFGVIAATL